MICRAGPDDLGRRLDRVCRKILPETGLGPIYSALRKGRIRVNGKKKPQSYRLSRGDEISFPDDFSPVSRGEQETAASGGEETKGPDLRSSILYEDSDFLVFNKPRGVLTHGKNSLQTFLLNYLRREGTDSLSFTPAPLHRLDRNSSGIVVCGKSIEGTTGFSKQLRSRDVFKVYLSINDAVLSSPRRWEDNLSRDGNTRISYPDPRGSRAVMHAFPLLHFPSNTFCLMVPVTGRTHQIRVQSAVNGFPLTGDNKYNPEKQQRINYYLHAYSLEAADFPALHAPLPEHFIQKLRRLASDSGKGKALDELLTGLTDEINRHTASIKSRK